MEMSIGKHYAKHATTIYSYCETVSVGVCLVGSTSRGEPRLNKAIVRVSGPNTEDGVKKINAMAEKIAKQLDDGVYNGPKTVKVQ